MYWKLWHRKKLAVRDSGNNKKSIIHTVIRHANYTVVVETDFIDVGSLTAGLNNNTMVKTIEYKGNVKKRYMNTVRLELKQNCDIVLSEAIKIN